MTCKEVEELLPAHALDALDRDEAHTLERHLAACRPCRAELAAFRDVAGHLAMAMPPVAPSPELRRRVLNAAAGSERPGLLSRLALWWSSRWPAVVRLSPVMAILALVVSLGSIFWAATAQVSLDRQMAENRLLAARLEAREQLVASLSAPGVEVRELRAEAVAPGAQAVMVINRESPAAVLSTRGLPQLPGDRVYQLWLIRDGQRTSGGIFTVAVDGSSRLEISAPQPLGVYGGVGVTIEPAGGSPGPTGARVLAGSL